MWGVVSGDYPVIGFTIVWLVFLEGLLSADNALVLAMMVRHLPKEAQKRALRYGIWGAFVFRFIAVGLANYLLDFWLLKVAGGLYLLYLAINHFVSRVGSQPGSTVESSGRGFWKTVIAVELADIAFSIDSILAAVALAEGLPETIDETWQFGIVITGGILGIITMRFVAGYFIQLLERFRGLETGAYGLVAWIGLKLTASGLENAKAIPFEMNEWVFWGGMLLIALFGFIYQPKEKPSDRTAPKELVDEVTRLAGGEESDPSASLRS